MQPTIAQNGLTRLRWHFKHHLGMAVAKLVAVPQILRGHALRVSRELHKQAIHICVASQSEAHVPLGCPSNYLDQRLLV